MAVTEDKRQSYDQMEEQLLKQESFIGVLSANSTNILELVSRGYYDFIRYYLVSSIILKTHN